MTVYESRICCVALKYAFNILCFIEQFITSLSLVITFGLLGDTDDVKIELIISKERTIETIIALINHFFIDSLSINKSISQLSMGINS